jgi:glucose-fructose oxidoreductase
MATRSMTPRPSSIRNKQVSRKKKVRYAVIGLGHIAQVAVLPAFKHAEKNSELVALFSGDATKRRELGRHYQVPLLSSYEQYDSILRGEKIDAVYIAEPNSLHCDFAVRAAESGVHVLCEKPLAVTEQQCERMIDACKRNHVKLMTAYRLHFEESNLEAIRIVNSGRIGKPRFFNSIFSMQAQSGNIRLQKKLGGGPVYDLGVYCINASRYLFQDEPIEVEAITAASNDKRFRQVEEMAGAILRFPGERIASFVCSFGAADTADYQVVGTKGVLRMKNAYEYASQVEMSITIDEKTQKREFAKRDQFGPELVYFSDCILKNKKPEPDGIEGLNDVRVIHAIYQSAKTGKRIKLRNQKKTERPSPRQQIRRRPVPEPKIIKASSASR